MGRFLVSVSWKGCPLHPESETEPGPHGDVREPGSTAGRSLGQCAAQAGDGGRYLGLVLASLFSLPGHTLLKLIMNSMYATAGKMHDETAWAKKSSTVFTIGTMHSAGPRQHKAQRMVKPRLV